MVFFFNFLANVSHGNIIYIPKKSSKTEKLSFNWIIKLMLVTYIIATSTCKKLNLLYWAFYVLLNESDLIF